MNDRFYQLMLLTQKGATSTKAYLEFIFECARAGITALQLREKGMTQAQRIELGLELKEVLAPYSIPLIVNDSVNLACEIDAEGVHLGQSDGCPRQARELLGPKKIIGVSVESIDQLKAANAAPINYVGISAVFPTTNKSDVTTTCGLVGLQKRVRLSIHPVVGIGGIHAKNAAEVMRAGAHGIAVIGSVHTAENPALEVRKLKEAVSADYRHF